MMNRTAIFVGDRPHVGRSLGTFTAAILFICQLLASPLAHAGEAELKLALDGVAARLTDMHAARSAKLTRLWDNTTLRNVVANPDNKAYRNELTHFANNLQRDMIGREFCLIDSKGRELMRLVDGVPAPDSELADDEADAPYFKDTFRKTPGEIHIGPIYLSPDANEWVLAYTTPVQTKSALLHYEHPLRQYHDALSEGFKNENRFLLVTDRAGFVIIDSRAPIFTHRIKGKSAMRDYFKPIDLHFEKIRTEGTPEFRAVLKAMQDGKAGTATAGLRSGEKYAIAYRTVGEWTLALFEKQ